MFKSLCKILVIILALIPLACSATCMVTFSRFEPGVASVIPIGATIESPDSQYTFKVIADTSNPAFDADANGYHFPAALMIISVPVSLSPDKSHTGTTDVMISSNVMTSILCWFYYTNVPIQ